MSPYIFILCMELLLRRIDYEVDIRKWNPISISQRGPKISHLFFVNDLLLLAKVGVPNRTIIKDTLTRFSYHSGQKVNVRKSKVFFSKNAKSDLKQRIQDIL